MLLHKKINPSKKLINFLFCLFPISLVIGSLIVNLNMLLFLLISLLYIKFNSLKIKFKHISKILVCFFVFIIITTSLNIETFGYENTLKSVLLLRFLILYLVLETLFANNAINLRQFFISCLICTTFISFDLIIQYVFGHNLLGYEPWENMITGMFEHEAIAGSYIQKLSLFSFFGIFFLLKDSKYKYYIFSFIVLLHLIATFLANNRMSFIILLISLIILLFVFKKIKYYLLATLILFSAVSYNLYNYDEQIKGRYLSFVSNIYSKNNEIKKNSENLNNNSNNLKQIQSKFILNTSHNRIFSTAIESWKTKPLIGNGLKSFREDCKKFLKFKNRRCSTHPHNYHLEILHDTGILGLFFISIFVFYKIYRSFKLYFFEKKENFNDIYLIAPIMISFLIEVWPIKSSGSMFTTWNGSIVWLIVALTTYYTVNKKNK